jgi:hypothetical protein
MPAEKCVRCRQALPEGSSYCVSCGADNVEALLARRVEATQQADARISWLRFVRNLFRGARYGRWFH